MIINTLYKQKYVVSMGKQKQAIRQAIEQNKQHKLNFKQRTQRCISMVLRIKRHNIQWYIRIQDKSNVVPVIFNVMGRISNNTDAFSTQTTIVCAHASEGYEHNIKYYVFRKQTVSANEIVRYGDKIQ